MAKGKYQEWLTEEGLIRIQGWARDGLSDEQIAKNMGIVPSTFYEWKKKYQEFSEATREGKDVPDRKVENALYKSCFDRTIPVLKAFKVKRVFYDDQGKRCEEEKIEMAEETVAIPASEKAQEFWLRNRKPADWPDKQKQEITGADGGALALTWDGDIDD
jgi:hypothetical protein|nr:MAG TPA: terminase small subunit [Caudoviricetes sp.]